MKYIYQVVLQFSPKQMGFDSLVEIEGFLKGKLIGDYVDGNDIGKDEMNIFILTNEPEKCFNNILPLIKPDIISKLKAAYRKLDGDDFVILYPKDLKAFDVL